jgi:outer membrane protein
MRNPLLAASILAGLVAMATPALAQAPAGKKAGDFMVRGRLIGVMPLDSASSTSIGGKVATAASAAPEVDFSYFITDNLAVELIAATTKHYIRAKGTVLGDVKVGSTWVLPPTVTLQYHFLPKEKFSPYLGAGLNYTIFYGSDAAAGLGSLKLSNNLGYAVQAGFDYALSERMYLNVDVKQIFLSTNAKVLNGAVRAKTDLNPLVLGVGVGWKF